MQFSLDFGMAPGGMALSDNINAITYNEVLYSDEATENANIQLESRYCSMRHGPVYYFSDERPVARVTWCIRML